MCASWPLITPGAGSPSRRSPAPWAPPSWIWPRPNTWASAASCPWATGWTWSGEAEVLVCSNQDPHTQVIALYLEGVKRASYFLDALREAEKPVVILKAGRTVQGSRAAKSHTKSMAGTDAIYDALFRKYRVHRADTLEELFDLPRPWPISPSPKGRKLMISTSSGGAAILAIDEAKSMA